MNNSGVDQQPNKDDPSSSYSDSSESDEKNEDDDNNSWLDLTDSDEPKVKPRFWRPGDPNVSLLDPDQKGEENGN